VHQDLGSNLRLLLLVSQACCVVLLSSGVLLIQFVSFLSLLLPFTGNI